MHNKGSILSLRIASLLHFYGFYSETEISRFCWIARAQLENLKSSIFHSALVCKSSWRDCDRKLSGSAQLLSHSHICDAFFRKYLEDRPGLDDSKPKSNDHIEFSNQWSYQYNQYYTSSISSPSCTNSWIPRSWRYLVSILTRIYQLWIGLISVFCAVSGSILEH